MSICATCCKSVDYISASKNTQKCAENRENQANDGHASKNPILTGGKLSVSTTFLEILIFPPDTSVLWVTLRGRLLLIGFFCLLLLNLLT